MRPIPPKFIYFSYHLKDNGYLISIKESTKFNTFLFLEEKTTTPFSKLYICQVESTFKSYIKEKEVKLFVAV